MQSSGKDVGKIEATEAAQSGCDTLGTDATQPGTGGRLDDRTQAAIGQRLKAVYSEIVQEPVPERFLKLLEELEQKERRQ